jgi:hypothetical protein
MTTKMSPLKRAYGAFKSEMKPKQQGGPGHLLALELALLGVGAGIFMGFAISEHPSFMKTWGWLVPMGFWLASGIVAAIRERRLRKLPSDEDHAA